MPQFESGVEDGRIGREELKILGKGLAAAVIVYAIPFTRFVFSALITLFHELGHAVVGWILGHPGIPAFDFVYGGGFTHMTTFKLPVAVVVAMAFSYLLWLFRENRHSMAIIATLCAIWLVFVTREWRRELAVAAAGHAFEFVMAAIFFYRSLAGSDRAAGAFVAFFVQIHSTLFAWRLINDPGYLAWYREGKGGALMNDLEVVALDLQIYLGLNPGIVGVAKMLLVFSVMPTVVALVWYFERARWHRVAQTLLSAQR